DDGPREQPFQERQERAKPPDQQRQQDEPDKAQEPARAEETEHDAHHWSCLCNTTSIRRLSSRPSGVALEPIGSASARPSAVTRPGSPSACTMNVRAASALARDNW